MRLTVLLVLLAATAATAQGRLTEAQVRAHVARQESAWNAGDLDAWFATFAPGAVFTDQALGSDNRIVPYGTSTMAQAREQIRRALKAAKVAETVHVRKVALGPTGRGAAVSADVRTRIESERGVRRSCAQRLATMALVRGRLVTLAQTDTLVRCRPAP